MSSGVLDAPSCGIVVVARLLEKDGNNDDEQDEAAEAEGEGPVHDVLSTPCARANPPESDQVPTFSSFDEWREQMSEEHVVAVSI